MPLQPKNWRPNDLIAVARSYDTSVGTTEVETDIGRAYLKPMGNRSGPHVLACEWVATHLAQLVNLPTFEFNLLVLGATDIFPLPRNNMAAAGPSFAARAMVGHPWGASREELDELVNPEDVSRLVVFDTWVKNCDRHPPDLTVRKPNPDNVFLAEMEDPPGLKLIVSDHTHCFTCGRDLNARISDIDKIQDERVYGLFPAFVPLLSQEVVEDFSQVVRNVSEDDVETVINTVPREWEVPNEARMALKELILRRAGFVADNIITWLFPT